MEQETGLMGTTVGDAQRAPSLYSIPLVLFFVGLFLFIALLNDQEGLSTISLLVLGTAAAANLWARMSLSGLQITAMLDRTRVFPGEDIAYSVVAENAKLLPVWLRVDLPPGKGILPSGPEGGNPSRESGLLWYQKARFDWTFTAGRRGVHAIGPPRMIVADLLGFFPREGLRGTPRELIIYPRLLPLKGVPLPRRDLFEVPGARSPVQDPVYILGTRDYRPSSPARHIHWKASARHNRLQEKVFEPSAQAKVLMVIDVQGFAGSGAETEFERTLEVAASLAVRLERQSFALGLLTNGRTAGGGEAMIRISRNPRKLPDILERLARLQMVSERPLEEAFLGGLSIPWGVSAVHFSREGGETVRPAERYFSRRNIPCLFVAARAGAGGAECLLDDLRLSPDGSP